jgi:hypothetical protein
MNMDNFIPGIGFHYIQEMEANGDNVNSTTVIGASGGQVNNLSISLEY